MEAITLKVPEATRDELERRAEEFGSKSAAGRHALRVGLGKENPARDRASLRSVAVVCGVLWVVAVAAVGTEAAAAVGGAGLAYALAWSVWPAVEERFGDD
jgi:Arc/MetJ-type ribon-helix-helix transcriptional regulator